MLVEVIVITLLSLVFAVVFAAAICISERQFFGKRTTKERMIDCMAILAILLAIVSAVYTILFEVLH